MPSPTTTTTTTSIVMMKKVVVPTVVALFTAAVAKNWVQIRRRNRREKQFLSYQGSTRRPAVGTVVGRIRQVNIFPGKSMAGVSLQRCPVSHFGLEGDRMIMVVKISECHAPVVVTQRMIPQLCRIRAKRIVTKKATKSQNNNSHTNNLHGMVVTLSLPEDNFSSKLEPICLNLDELCQKHSNTTTITLINLHTLKANSVDLGDEAADWISKAIQILKQSTTSPSKNKRTNTAKNHTNPNSIAQHHFRLFTLAPGEYRRVYGNPAQLLFEDARPTDTTLLSDLAPLTLTSEASLDKLNEKIMVNTKHDNQQSPIPMDRFRSNLVVEMNSPNYAFLEDLVAIWQIGSTVQLRCMGPSPRCVIPTVDQHTGVAGFQQRHQGGGGIRKAEPMASLKKWRCGGMRYGMSGLLPKTAGGSKSWAPVFGIYAGLASHDENDTTTTTTTVKEIVVGDPVSVVEYKSGALAESGWVGDLATAISLTLGLDRAVESRLVHQMVRGIAKVLGLDGSVE